MQMYLRFVLMAAIARACDHAKPHKLDRISILDNAAIDRSAPSD